MCLPDPELTDWRSIVELNFSKWVGHYIPSTHTGFISQFCMPDLIQPTQADAKNSNSCLESIGWLRL